MAVNVLRARAFAGRLSFVLHLDTTKMDLLDPSKPDPRWMLSRDWALPPNWSGRTAGERTAIQNGIKAELQAAAAAQIAKLNDEDSGGVVLPMEGTTIG